MAIHPYAWGSSAWGAGRWGGDVSAVITPAVEVSGLGGIAGNDRCQIILLTDTGADGAFPEFRYWLAQPPEWGAVLGSAQRDAIPKFYALDETGTPVTGALELPFEEFPRGQLATVAGVLVSFVPRPTALGDFDGGLNEDTALSFSCAVEAYGVPSLARPSGIGERTTGVVMSDRLAFSTAANAVDDDAWPAYFTAWLPCRIPTAVRAVRASIRDQRHVEIIDVEVMGQPEDPQYG